MNPRGAGLLELAKHEADVVEQEIEEGADVSLIDPDPEEETEVGSEPGEQGSATQDDDVDQPEAEPFTREATKDQVSIARQIRADLERRAATLGPTVVADMLMQCVDIDPLMTFPTTWDYGEKRYAESDVLRRVGNVLLKGFHEKLELSPQDVAWRLRNSKNWTKRGVTVLCEAKVVPPWARELTGNVAVGVFANYQVFRLINSLRRVKAIYHALRGLDDEARRLPPHYNGWLDELEYFGPMTFEDEVRLVNAIERGKDRSSLPFQLDLLAATE